MTVAAEHVHGGAEGGVPGGVRGEGRGELLAWIADDPSRALVGEGGWRSSSHTAAHRLDQRPVRPVSEHRRTGTTTPTAPHRTTPASPFVP
jgi:hypothetical protein